MIENCLFEHIKVARKLENQLNLIKKAGNLCVNALKQNKKIIICGNGGSAADAQHIAAELVGKFNKERKALKAIALTTDTSILTSIGNDYGFEYIFSRQIEAFGEEGDILIAISTSGNSENVLNAILSAKNKKCQVITMTGKEGGKIKQMGDINIIIPSMSTPRIQEMHIMIGHMICAIIDKEFEN